MTAGPVGTGAVSDPTGLEPSGVPDGTTVLWPATEVAVAEHCVQTVEVEVKVIVDTVLEVVTKVEEPEVTVSVTGQVVTVS